METLLVVVKMLLAWLSVFGLGFEPMSPGGDLVGKVTPPGDEKRYLQIEAPDTGVDIWNPGNVHGGYRYGPSMILNADGSLDVFSAANGPGDIVDMVNYKRIYNGGERCTREVVAVKPTAGGYDWKWTCDPGVIKFGGYYYVGYTTTLDERGVDNDVCVARSKTPEGPYEKWTGSGWGVLPKPLVEYTDNPECFGAGEPAFVLMGDTLYVYYSWNDETGSTTRVATADATDENWPATLQYHGECIPPKNGGDSADVKYVDALGRFVAVFTEKRFSDDSYVAVWESFDGIRFRPSGVVKTNTAKKLHNCGISGRADGHICEGDPVYLGYAYEGAGGSWGDWCTRLHKVELSLADAPNTDDTAQENVAVSLSRKKMSLIPEVITVKAEKQVYNLEKGANQRIWAMGIDTDGFVFPILTGVTFDGYDPDVIRIAGGRVWATGEGSTRVYLHWHGFSGDFLVNVAP